MSRTSRASALLAAGALAFGCGGPSVTSTQIRGPDGQDNWVAITCGGSQMACYARAGEVCPTGYEIADAAGHEGEASSSYASANSYGGVAVSKSTPTYNGQMLIRCKGAPVPPIGRECVDDGSCDTGQHCAFPTHGGSPGAGHCEPPTK